MEKQIKAIINSFIDDFDQQKLVLLEHILFSLLLEREAYLLQRKKSTYTKKIAGILSRYANYRYLIYETMSKKKKVDKNFLMRNIYISPQRLIVLLTHNCQLRCEYCRVSKFSSFMNKETLFKAIDLLFTSNSRELQLQFFGGEPLLKFDLIKKAVIYGEKAAKRLEKDLVFILTTNGIELTKEKVDFLKKHRFIIEYSIDGEVEAQLKTRMASNNKNYYSHMIDNFEYLKQSGIRHYSISVVMPHTVSPMFRNFKHLVDIGFESLQMNYSLGFFWPKKEVKTLFRQTEQILNYVKKHRDIQFINLTSARKEPVVLNAELTVDCDGGIYMESGICLEEDFIEMKNKFLVTDLEKAVNVNLYGSTPFQNFYRLSEIYGAANPKFREIILNNIFLGKKYNLFLKNEKSKIFHSL